MFEEALFRELKETLLSTQEDYEKIFLVGGYIRDKLAGRPSKDFDFVVKKNPIHAARSIADYFNGAFYVLDKERQIARALVKINSKDEIVVDCSLLDEGGISADLRKRDFTINAIAIDLADPDGYIDPLGGIEDLSARRLILCSERSLQLDPVRTLRSVRFIQSFDLNVPKDVREAIKKNAHDLANVSSERIRDEIFKIFSLDRIQGTLELFRDFGLFPVIFPEIPHLKDVIPGPPHVHNVHDHIFRVVEITGSLIRSVINPKIEIFEEPLLLASSAIEPFREELIKYFGTELTPGRNIGSLSHFAALYHDSAKGLITPVFEDGKNSFPDHAEMGAEIACTRGKELALSTVELDFVDRMIRNHMKKEFGPSEEMKHLNLWLYRFFKEVKSSGVAGCFLHLADIMATYEENLSLERWEKALTSVTRIMDGWFNRYDQVVVPDKLISGNDLIERFSLSPGKEIGGLIELVRENQVTGIVSNREDAFELVRKKLGDE